MKEAILYVAWIILRCVRLLGRTVPWLEDVALGGATCAHGSLSPQREIVLSIWGVATLFDGLVGFLYKSLSRNHLPLHGDIPPLIIIRLRVVDAFLCKEDVLVDNDAVHAAAEHVLQLLQEWLLFI